MFRALVVCVGLLICVAAQGAVSLSDFLPGNVTTAETNRNFFVVTEEAIATQVEAISVRRTAKVVEKVCAKLLSNARNGELRVHNWNGLLYVGSYGPGGATNPVEFQGLERLRRELRPIWRMPEAFEGFDLGNGFVLEAKTFAFRWGHFTNCISKEYVTESGAKARLFYKIQFSPRGRVQYLDIILKEEREDAKLGVRKIKRVSLTTLRNADLLTVDFHQRIEPFGRQIHFEFNANGYFAGWSSNETEMSFNEVFFDFFGRPAQRPLRISRQFLIRLLEAAREGKDFSPEYALHFEG